MKSTAASVLETIGNTPLVQLRKVVPVGSADVFVKLEFMNPTGSKKDRMALAMIEEAENRGDLQTGMTVVEYTGGSTGSSLAMICAVKGYRFRAVSSDAFAREKLQTMKAFGADLLVLPSEGGKTTPDTIPEMMAKAQSLAESDDCYFTNQIHNADIIVGYHKIGEEIIQQLDRRVDAFCAGVGTAGTLMGVSKALRQVYPEVNIVALEPATAAIISRGEAGTHDVEGIGISFVPPLLDPEFYDQARGIDEQEARRMARLLATEEGIFAGTSSGLNVVGALQLAQELGAGKTVVTEAADTGLKYLVGDLYRL
jgi:cysteine synthase A